MKCQRCLMGEEAEYRAYTDAIDMRVCVSCAEQARKLGIAVEVPDASKEEMKVREEPPPAGCQKEG